MFRSRVASAGQSHRAVLAVSTRVAEDCRRGARQVNGAVAGDRCSPRSIRDLSAFAIALCRLGSGARLIAYCLSVQA